MYDFSVYIGADIDEDVKKMGASAGVVANLCSTLPENLGHKVHCDNYFTLPNFFVH